MDPLRQLLGHPSRHPKFYTGLSLPNQLFCLSVLQAPPNMKELEYCPVLIWAGDSP